MSEKPIYFTPGPATMPAEVLKQISSELHDYQGMGCSVLEMSHRSKQFESIIEDAEGNLRKLLNIPDNYAVLFMHGGAKTQFDSAPMNLCPELMKSRADYLVNGSWSKMAAAEAKKYVMVDVQQPMGDTFDRCPTSEEINKIDGAAYRYYCDNETIQGLEYNFVPEIDGVPLVCDMTSNFLSRPVDVSKYGLIFAGAQKNCGIAGLAIVIVRKDLIGKQMSITPKIQNYKTMMDNKSLYNTPPTFAIYVAGLCFKWILDRGGLDAMDRFSREKSQLLYDAIDNSQGFYSCPVSKESRSRMNVVFLLADNSLDSKFLEEAKAAKLFELKGHRSVGGFRASMYHGITLENVRSLVAFMEDFRKRQI